MVNKGKLLIEKYFEVVGELRRRGFAVAVLDWRGQGGSSRLLRNDAVKEALVEAQSAEEFLAVVNAAETP